MSKFLPISILCLILSSCVSMKTYRQTRTDYLSLKYGYTEMQSQVEILKSRNAMLESEYEKANKNPRSSATNDRTAELEKLLQERDALLNSLSASLHKTLEYFKDKGVSMTRVGGNIYISVEDKLLFESGKYEITGDGEDAVSEIAAILAKNPDINIIVEGHTDDRGLLKKEGAEIVDNWDLSCKRATEVVRIMMQTKGIVPSRIYATGRSQFSPVAEGFSDIARQHNRRTEIIISPKLEKLAELLDL